MRLPWVSRARLEQAERSAGDMLRQAVESAARVAAADARYEALVREVLAMKREGFAPPPQPGPASPAFDFPIEVAAAIEDSTRGLPADIKRIVVRKASEMLAAKVKPAEVAEKIRRGDRVTA